ncbi:hypothetical protein B0A52_08223 [Exophiala mesophila]|uniref:DUF2423 domain-containing protein n=1 Tax=Exophiala mesophila TaxID=212818 RepID=A0A438MWK2_EXOME|nr:hypothetical protein B0A52_08223 [Exophiala mesophila]
MAKSARSSDTKRNNANLRKRVFGPAADARTARLSAKLQELAAKSRPTDDKIMEVDSASVQREKDQKKDQQSLSKDNDQDMDLDGQEAQPGRSKKAEKKRIAANKIHKVSKRKPRNQMVFSSERARKAKMASKKSR